MVKTFKHQDLPRVAGSTKLARRRQFKNGKAIDDGCQNSGAFQQPMAVSVCFNNTEHATADWHQTLGQFGIVAQRGV